MRVRTADRITLATLATRLSDGLAHLPASDLHIAAWDILDELRRLQPRKSVIVSALWRIVGPIEDYSGGPARGWSMCYVAEIEAMLGLPSSVSAYRYVAPGDLDAWQDAGEREYAAWKEERRRLDYEACLRECGDRPLTDHDRLCAMFEAL